MSIEVSGDVPEAKKFLSEQGITFPSLRGSWEMAGDRFGVRSTPASVLVDRAGRIVFSHSGFNARTGPALLDAEVEALLSRPAR